MQNLQSAGSAFLKWEFEAVALAAHG
jgi:hypothetical protein